MSDWGAEAGDGPHTSTTAKAGGLAPGVVGHRGSGTEERKADGMGHQEWKYFKTVQKYGEYWGQSQENIDRMKDAEREEVWVFRYGKWMEENRRTEMKHPEYHNKRERDHFEKHGWYNTYHDLLGKVSFGVRDYYYDWEF